MDSIEDRALKKIVDSINRRRQRQIEDAYDKGGLTQVVLTEDKRCHWDKNPVGKAGWQKVASIPMEVDRWFTEVYGADYYKDPEFFTKKHPEWRVVDVKRMRAR